MKNSIVIAIISVVIGLGGGWLFFGGQSGGAADAGSGSAESDGGRKIAYYQDPMHPWYTSDKPGKAPDCGMDMVPVYEGETTSEGVKIDPVTVQNIGVKSEAVEKRTLSKSVRTVGRVAFDETRVYSVNSKIMGWVENLAVDYTGRVVSKGEPLLDLYSPELVSTQEEYLQAIRYRRKLTEESLAEARRGADELIESAKRRLTYWDISEREIEELERRGVPKKTMTFHAPVDGIVIEKMVFEGQSVMPGMDLYKIADLSTIWVYADIYQYELPWVRLGQKATVTLSYMPGRTFRGTITYVYPTLNEETKTAKVRVEVRNTPGLDIKPEMFATVEIAAPVARDVVAVPDQAVIRSGERNIVVVALGGGYFDPREVTLGVTAGGYVEISEGLHEGETIVTSSQFLIDSESNLKSAIGLMIGHAGHDMSKPKDASMPLQEPVEQAEPTQKPMETHDHNGMGMVPKESKPPEATAAPSKMVVDPVCGMEIEPDESLAFDYEGKRYYFCMKDDMEKFKASPEKFVSKEHQH